MLDLFTIFSKGGIVLWCFQGTSQIFTPSVNALIKTVILQERTGKNTFDHNSLTLQYKLDNEFELIFVVAYQKILQLSYVDKFLDDIHLEFRDKYKDVLQSGLYFQDYEFSSNYTDVLRRAENWSKKQASIPRQMRSYEDSSKSKKTVASMIERKGDDKENKKKVKVVEPVKKEVKTEPEGTNGDIGTDDLIIQNRMKLAQKFGSPNARKTKPKTPKPTKEGKKPRVWDLSGGSKDLADLDRTKDKPLDDGDPVIQADTHLVGRMVGGIQDLEVESSTDEEEEDEEEEEEDSGITNKAATKSSGVFSMFK